MSDPPKLRFVVRLSPRPKLDAGVRALERGEPWPWLTATLAPVEQRLGTSLAVRPLFSTQSHTSLVRKAMRMDQGFRDPRFGSYLALTLRSSAHPPDVTALLEKVFGEDADLIYHDPPGLNPTLPGVSPSDDPLFNNQEYLFKWPRGIGVVEVWPGYAPSGGQPGADGNGVSFIDIEKDWHLQHADLVQHAITVLPGHEPVRVPFPNGPDASHGTKVLGVVAAVDNRLRCIGITPNLSSVRVASYESPTCDGFIAPAIVDAANALVPPAVLLIEIELGEFESEGVAWWQMPVEVCEANWAAIQAATAAGICVVECAGNGSRNLDLFRPAATYRPLYPNHARYADSGAILVAAGARRNGTWMRWRISTSAGSNYGRRVDAFAQGTSVKTLDCAYDIPTNRFFDHDVAGFSATSAAGAIVAGACASALGVLAARGRASTMPTQLRTALAASGHPPRAGSLPIGRMPDLAAFVAALGGG